jgi:hypothetical protein
MAEDTIQLEAFSTIFHGQISYILTKQDLWIPYEFLPSLIQTKMLLCGNDKSGLLTTDWKYVINNPTMQDWSVVCSIIKHLPPPAILYITKEVIVPAQALTFFQKVIASVGCSVFIERTESQLQTIQFPMMNSIFLPQVTVSQVQQSVQLYKAIIGQIPTMKSFDVLALLQQVAPMKLALVLAKNDEGKWRFYWYRLEESKPVELPKGQISSWLRAFANHLE